MKKYLISFTLLLFTYSNYSQQFSNFINVSDSNTYKENNIVEVFIENIYKPPISDFPISFSESYHSYSQMFYYPSEVKYVGGLITSLKFKSKFEIRYNNNDIIVMIGETNKVNFDYNYVNDWIPPIELIEVFNGKIDILAGDKLDVEIPFDIPYQYNGNTLIIYTCRIANTFHSYYGAQFYCSWDYYNTYRSKHSNGRMDADFTLMNPPDGSSYSVFADIKLSFDVSGLGALTGIITDETTGNALEGVVLKIEDRFETTTDINGEYFFEYLNHNELEVSISKFGYYDKTVAVEITSEEPVTQNISLETRDTYTISGMVTDINGDGLENVKIIINGYNDYTCVTDQMGNYSISVYDWELEYKFAALKINYLAHTTTLLINESDISYNFILEETEYPYSPVNVTANYNNDNVTVEWESPDFISQFRYDSGTPSGWIGAVGGKRRSLFGSVCRTSATLTKMSWLTINVQSPKVTKLDLWVFGLNENGIPNFNNLLLNVPDVPITHWVWDEYQFSEPLEAPFGFFMALSSEEGYIGLACDFPNEEYPFMYNTNYFVSDYYYPQLTSGFNEYFGYYFNFMIRGEGFYYGEYVKFGYIENNNFADLSENRTDVIQNALVNAEFGTISSVNSFSFLDMKSPPYFAATELSAIVDYDSNERIYTLQFYNIYRLKKGEPEEKWVMLAENVQDLIFIDNNWNTLSWGEYQYAIKAIYETNISKSALSNVVPKDMFTDLTINITTNSGKPATGAFIKLTNQSGNTDHEYTVTIGDDGAQINGVWKGVYNLLVTLDEYERYSITGLEISEDNQTENVILQQKLFPVSSVRAEIYDDKINVEWVVPVFLPTTFVFDDNSVEGGFIADTMLELSFGNEYNVNEDGFLTSFDIYSIKNDLIDYFEDYPRRFLVVDIYDDKKQLISSSAPFMFNPDNWINVPVDYVPFSGKFYAMVRFTYNIITMTHGLAIDENGTHSESRLSWYIDPDGSWWNLRMPPNYLSLVFMIRANAMSAGETISYFVDKTKESEIEETMPVNVISIEELAQQGIIKLGGTSIAPELENVNHNQINKIDKKSYSVFRLLKDEPENKWTILSNDINETIFTDTEWDTLEMGIYHYAVKAEYETGLSRARLSNSVPRLMESEVTVNVSTNNGDPVTGSFVTLTNQDGIYEYTNEMNKGNVVFPKVWKGYYNITVYLEGFYIYEDFDILIDANQFTIDNIVLIERIIKPFGLEITQTENEKERLFTWNNYGFEPRFYDFENYEDWMSFDYFNDWWTFSRNKFWTKFFYEYSIPPIGFYLLNHTILGPSPFFDDIIPYSGNKCIYAFSSIDGTTDTWAVTLKELPANCDMILSFWAKSIVSDYGLERFSVAYSTEDFWEIDWSELIIDFSKLTFVTNDPYIEVPTTWTKYSYIIPDGANRIAIICKSHDALALMIDDISISFVDQSASKSVFYKIYLNDIEVGSTYYDTSFMFQELESGTYIAGVKAVYITGETAIVYSDSFKVTEVDISTIHLSDLVLYPNPFTKEINISNPSIVKRVEITNVSGQKVKDVVYEGKTISTGKLTGGVYFVIIESVSGDKTVYKMIKQL